MLWSENSIESLDLYMKHLPKRQNSNKVKLHCCFLSTDTETLVTKGEEMDGAKHRPILEESLYGRRSRSETGFRFQMDYNTTSTVKIKTY